MVVGVVAVLTAGCSSSTHSSQGTTATTLGSTQTAQGTSPTTQASTGGSVRGVTSSEITVGGLVTVLDFGPGAAKAAQARFIAANNSGEIPGGRKIRYVGYADDGGSPDQNLSVTRRLIDQDHVFAIVPALTPFEQSGGVYLNQQHVPAVGWGISPVFCPTSNPSATYAFAFNGCLTPSPPT
jgi:hypothetical protein